MTKDKDIGHRGFVRGDIDSVFEDGSGCFGKHALGSCFLYRDEAGALCLIEGLGKGSLAWSRRAAIRSDLGPAFAEKVAELPARLYSRSEEFFVRLPAFALVLAETEEHFS